MRLVTFGVGNSLDNFIAREDHAVDWLCWDAEVASVTAAYWKTIDTVIMGRKTYEAARRHGMPSYPGVRNLVFSRTLRAGPDDKVEIIAEDAARFVRRLKNRKGKGVCVMGGGILAKALFEADLIDEIGLNVHPVVLGSGIPLFLPMPCEVKLKLAECRTFKNGCVLLRYRVQH
jgi:dihydrofolate reductase